MPLYCYRCRCGEEKEIEQSMMDAHTYKCHVCGFEMDRVFYPSRFQFVGRPAWYDKKKAALDGEYNRQAHLKISENRRPQNAY